MGISYKYFVTCIIAVFLALATGILMGFMINGEGFLKDQSTKLLKQATQRMNKLNDVNTKLTDENKRLQNNVIEYGKYAESANRYLLKDRLKGMNITVIETTDDYMYYNSVMSLKDAGANIVDYIIVKSSTMNNNQKLEEKLRQFLIKKGVEVSDNVYEDFFRQIALGITNKNGKSIIEFGRKMGVIQVNQYGAKPVDNVILAGGAISEDEAEVDVIDEAFIDELQDNNINVIGVENSNVTYSYIDQYATMGLSTVDNIETPIGIASLVMVLKGQTGNYGFKSNASEAIPEGFEDAFKVSR